MANSILVVGLLGLFFGIFLSFVYTKFKIEENPLFSKIYELLPKANCGACGFAGCSAFAESLIENKTTPEKCVMVDKLSLVKICEILGIEAEKKEKFVARILCHGGVNAKKKFEYTTIKTCNALNAIFDTNFECIYGCLGLADCVRICPVNAITIKENGLPEINEEKCIGCGKCVQICPKKIIKLLPYDKKVYIACSSFEKGAIVVKICNSGCIGCGRCAKVCPQNAIKIENNLAIIDYERCDNCGKCVEECPRKIIFFSKVSILA
ncbi:MAG: RnfABCDGE type electron transport complex subunit B [Candidatus Omnitrophica bacterium]|nr:RnfABCDGE type electron transport complex subunit B [Candidatus Omnitrophota bacterium]MCM8803222.1 RnfABCDGE type electron transport complex subunit B [Candidatus Omnitrophota bacterium]